MSEAARERAQSAIVAHLRAMPSYRAARLVGTFFGFDGEPDLGGLIVRDAIKRFCVPVLRGDRMRFARISTATRCAPNFFGILEPEAPDFVDPRTLDLVLTPLVAFDDRGVRLGVGRGYYDRCFSFLRSRSTWYRPKILGIAYSFQREPLIEARDWDVPLWGVVTEHGARVFR